LILRIGTYSKMIGNLQASVGLPHSGDKDMRLVATVFICILTFNVTCDSEKRPRHTLPNFSRLKGLRLLGRSRKEGRGGGAEPSKAIGCRDTGSTGSGYRGRTGLKG